MEELGATVPIVDEETEAANISSQNSSITWDFF